MPTAFAIAQRLVAAVRSGPRMPDRRAHDRFLCVAATPPHTPQKHGAAGMSVLELRLGKRY